MLKTQGNDRDTDRSTQMATEFRNVDNTPETMPVGTRVARVRADGAVYGTVKGWSADGQTLCVEFDSGSTNTAPAHFRSYALVVEVPDAAEATYTTLQQAWTGPYCFSDPSVVAMAEARWEALSNLRVPDPSEPGEYTYLRDAETGAPHLFTIDNSLSSDPDVCIYCGRTEAAQ